MELLNKIQHEVDTDVEKFQVSVIGRQFSPPWIYTVVKIDKRESGRRNVALARYFKDPATGPRFFAPVRKPLETRLRKIHRSGSNDSSHTVAEDTLDSIPEIIIKEGPDIGYPDDSPLGDTVL